MNNIQTSTNGSFFDYFNPTSAKFKEASSDFHKLSPEHRIGVVALTIIAGLFSLGVFAIPVFRFSVEKMKKNEAESIDVVRQHSQLNTNNNSPSSTTTVVVSDNTNNDADSSTTTTNVQMLEDDDSNKLISTANDNTAQDIYTFKNFTEFDTDDGMLCFIIDLHDEHRIYSNENGLKDGQIKLVKSLGVLNSIQLNEVIEEIGDINPVNTDDDDNRWKYFIDFSAHLFDISLETNYENMADKMTGFLNHLVKIEDNPDESGVEFQKSVLKDVLKNFPVDKLNDVLIAMKYLDRRQMQQKTLQWVEYIDLNSSN